MLFDLRGRGRRRTVQAIYLGLAVLIGLGLIGFGIGGGFGGGGLLNAINSSNGSASASYTDLIKADQKRAARTPNDPAVWAALASDLFHQAGAGANYDQTNGAFTSSAQPVLTQTAQAWQQYLSLAPHPNTNLAAEMISVYTGTNSLNQPAQALRALEIVLPTRTPSESLYIQLAELAYQSHNVRQGDLASAQAVALSPKAQQTQVKAELAALKANPNLLSGATSSSAPATGAQTVTTSVSPTPSPSVTTSVPASTTGSGKTTKKK